MMAMHAMVNFLIRIYNYGLVSFICYTDINECLLEEGVCPAGSRCMNTIGSYTCTCGTGYFLFTKNNTCSGRKFNIFDTEA